MKSLYRVSYPVGGQAKTSFVVAETDSDASYFVGVRDGSAAVSEVAKNVEIVGIDTQHDAIVPIPPSTAPFDSPKWASRAEVDSMQAQIAELRRQLAGQGTKVSTDQP